MAIFDVYYREKGNKNDELKTKTISAHTKSSALIIAKGSIPKNMTIEKCIKVC
ncbi:hypothetical protein ACSW8S_16585 (plasmid) [Clostridium perfringens]